MAVLRTFGAVSRELDAALRLALDEGEGTRAVDGAGGVGGTYFGAFALGTRGGPVGGGVDLSGAGGGVAVDGAAGAPTELRLGFLGDSLFEGFGLPGFSITPDDDGDSAPGSIPNTISQRLRDQGIDVNTVIRAQSGHRLDQVVNDGFVRDLIAADLDAVVINIGTNDVLQELPVNDLGQFEALLTDVVQQFQAAGVEVFLSGTFGFFPDFFSGEGLPAEQASAFEAIFARVADATGATFLGNLFGGVRIGTERIEGGVLDGSAPQSGDGLHPDPNGVIAVADRFTPQIGSVLTDPLAIARGSIELFFVADTLAGEGPRALVEKRAGDGGNDLAIQVNQIGQVIVELGDLSLRSDPGLVRPGIATHLVLVFGATGAQLFVDGNLVAALEMPSSGLTGNFGAFRIGSFADGSALPFDGLIDEVTVYTSPLTAEQVSTLAVGKTLVGTPEADILVGSDADETFEGGVGADEIRAGSGDDVVRGGDDAELIVGDVGDDLLFGESGVDRLFGGIGDDVALGQAGADRIEGGPGADRLEGGAGDDRLLGDDGADTLLGGDGNDLLDGGTGADRLFGGSGADTFRIATAGPGIDVVADFEAGAGDVLDLSSILDVDGGDIGNFVRLTEQDGNTRVDVDLDGGGDVFQTVAVLFNSTGLDLGTLVADGNLVVDQPVS